MTLSTLSCAQPSSRNDFQDTSLQMQEASSPLSCLRKETLTIESSACRKPSWQESESAPSIGDRQPSHDSSGVASTDKVQAQGILLRRTTGTKKAKKTVGFDKRYSVTYEEESSELTEEAAGRKISDVEAEKQRSKTLEWEEERRMLGFNDDGESSLDFMPARSRGSDSGNSDEMGETLSMGRTRSGRERDLEDLLGDHEGGDAVGRTRSGNRFEDLEDMLGGEDGTASFSMGRARSGHKCEDLEELMGSDDGMTRASSAGRSRSGTRFTDLADLLSGEDSAAESSQEISDYQDVRKCRSQSSSSRGYEKETVERYEDDSDCEEKRRSVSFLEDIQEDFDGTDSEAFAHAMSMTTVASDPYVKPLWDISQTALICKEGEEYRFQDKAELLQKIHSVNDAVEYLNTAEGYDELSEGMCIVFSATRRKYFLLYRTDQKSAAFIIFNLSENPGSEKTLRV